MSQRIEKLKEAIRPEKYPFCTEKVRLYTKAYKEAEGEAQNIRRAKGVANVLDNISIFIEDGELIVGNAASKPMGFEVSYSGRKGVAWKREELDELRRDEGYIITEQDEAEIREVVEYWQSRVPLYRQGKVYDERRLLPFRQSGVLLPIWKNREEGPIIGQAEGGLGIDAGIVLVDYEKVLNSGLNQVVEEAEQELRNTRFTSADSVKKVYFLQAVIIVYKAIIRYANRFAVLATGLASKEADPIRKKELERIAATSQWVPANPARDFREAIQSFWFIFLMLADGVAPIGRFDQFMYPFYRKDIKEGRISDDEVLELLQCLRIKDMQINSTHSRRQREKSSGLAKWNNMVIGGVTPDGKDATNELTYLILEAAKRCQTPHHTITLRVHEKIPQALMLKALEVVKTGIGMPAFIADGSYIEYLLSQGVPLKLARNYAIGGCLEACLIGQSRNVNLQSLQVAVIFDLFLHNGMDPRSGRQLGLKTGDVESFESFDDLLRAFKEQFAYCIALANEINNIDWTVRMEIFPNPISSALMADGIKEAKDILDRTFPFENGSGINAIGMINVADSMAAMKKLVFEEKKVTMKELKAALAANWQGYEEMRKMFLGAPKYGNDDDYVDSIARDLYQFFADTVATLDTLFGKAKPSAYSTSAHQPGGAITGATPDGRYDGEVLADGTMSPMRGRDTHGPTAVIKSALKIDQVPYQSTLLNMKFHPSALKTTEDLRKLSDLIRTYFSLGGKHIQFNVVDRDTLLNAQKHPENYRDLVVRVAGYSAYFVQLTKGIQADIIERVEHKIA